MINWNYNLQRISNKDRYLRNEKQVPVIKTFLVNEKQVIKTDILYILHFLSCIWSNLPKRQHSMFRHITSLKTCL